jgi:hypothetical protein
MSLPPSMEMELMNLGLIRSDLEELGSIARQYYRNTEQKIKERRQAMMFGILLLTVAILSFTGFAFLFVKAMLFITGLLI